MKLDHETAMLPWDGRWFMDPPRGMRLMSITRYTAQQLLDYGSALTNWDAFVLQHIIAQDDEASALQRYWLNHISAKVTDLGVAA